MGVMQGDYIRYSLLRSSKSMTAGEKAARFDFGFQQ